MFRQYYFFVDLMGMDNTTLKETASSNQKTMNNNLLILYVTKIHKYNDEHNKRKTNNK
jgi:hypothetical protein